MSRAFTRQEFYDLVWSKPMTHLAKDFALSDVALHKVCRKHDVPNPPPGWWAKKAAGKRVKQTPLPKVKAATSDKITIAAGARTDCGRARFPRDTSVLSIMRVISHPLLEWEITRVGADGALFWHRHVPRQHGNRESNPDENSAQGPGGRV